MRTAGVSADAIIDTIEACGLKPIHKHYVYALIEDGATDPFYIGVTTDIDRRFQAHCRSKYSGSAHKFIQAAQAAGRSVSILTLKAFALRGAAEDYERELINKLPRLTNVRGREWVA